VPVSGEGHRHHRLGEQDEGRHHAQQQHRGLLAVTHQVAQRGRPEQQDADRGHRHQRTRCRLGGSGVVERRSPRQRHGHPDHDRRDQDEPQRSRVTHDPPGQGWGLQRRRGCQAAGDQEAHRHGDDEAGVGAGQQHPGRGERVDREEAGAGQQRQRHQEQAGVAPVPGRVACRIRERRADHPCGQHQPEVRRVMLPARVERRLGDEQPEAGERDEEER
jgi:hypothetical protein